MSTIYFRPLETMATTPPSNPAALRLRKKLIQLSLELDDRTKSIALLSNALRQEEESHALLVADLTEQSNSELQAPTIRHKRERSELLDRINTSLSEKKELAAKVQSLVDSKKDQEAKMSAAVASLRKQIQERKDEAFAAWKAGEASRTETFFKREAAQIKQQTVKALEPEVKKIMETHRESISMLEAEEESTRNNLETQALSDYEEKIEAYRSDIKHQYEANVAEIQRKWNDVASQAHDEQTIVMAELRDKLFKEREIQRRERADKLKQVTDRHAKELSEARSEKDVRLDKLRREHKTELQQVKEKAENELKTIVTDAERHKLEWEKDASGKLEAKRSQRIKDAESDITKRREAEIEQIIRKSQKEQLLHERNCRADRDKHEKTMRLEHSNELKGIIVETRRQQDRLSMATAGIVQFQEKQNKLEEELSLLRDECNDNSRCLANVQARMAKKTEEGSQAMAMVALEKENAIFQYNEHRQMLKEGVSMVTEQARSEQIRHDERVATIEANHENILDELDASARKDLADIEKRRADIARVIEDESTRIEHLQTMLLRYTEEREQQKEDICSPEDKHTRMNTRSSRAAGDDKKKEGRGRIRKVLKSIRNKS